MISTQRPLPTIPNEQRIVNAEGKIEAVVLPYESYLLIIQFMVMYNMFDIMFPTAKPKAKQDWDPSEFRGCLTSISAEEMINDIYNNR